MERNQESLRPFGNWHDLPAADVMSAHSVTLDGLSEAEASERLKSFGPNCLPEAQKPSPVWRFLLQFHHILIYVLLGAASITAVLGHFIDTAVIVAVVIVNALLGFIQEGKAEKALEAIHHMLAPQAAVIRSGMRQTIAGDMLVPGDVVLLEAGDKVPADLRLFESHGLQIQEAILTGESVPVEKQIHPVAAGAALGDRTSMAFSGTIVTSGQAKGVVVATGAATEIGSISTLLAGVDVLTTPLVQQMGEFAKWLTILILTLSALILVYGYFVQHHEFSELFMAVVGLSVAAIPEGLPAVLTITLAIGVQAMAKRQAIIRRLPIIETLGAVSVICTDKTGTLTRNEMMVTAVVTQAERFAVEGTGYEPTGLIRSEGAEVSVSDVPILSEIGEAAALCNDADVNEKAGIWIAEGDPMEGALVAFSHKAGVEVNDLRTKRIRADVIPFDAKHRFMATLHHDDQGGRSIFAKGAPEQIIGMCSHQKGRDGGTEPIGPQYWLEQADRLAMDGQRVLAIAARQVESDHDDLTMTDVDGPLTLLGLMGLLDPPRPEATAAIENCHHAGIAVKMITGDHVGTARAIGAQIGIQNPERVLTGADLDKFDDAVLAIEVLNTNIFARTSPEHKLRLVVALQAHGHIVAMTGDGVNDSPALKRADAGIAMGINGSEASKEAADLVLADDNFASIVEAVRQGRTVYDNLRKVISWTLPTSSGEAMVIVLALLIGLTLPITAVQILWVNLVTAVTLGVALAFEPTEEDTMHRKPRSRNAPLLDRALVWHIVLVSILFMAGVFGMFVSAIDRGYSVELARTIAVNTLVVMEIFHLFFIRNIYGTSLTWEAVRGTLVVWISVAIVTIAQFGITYITVMQRIFSTEPVPLGDGLLIVSVGAVLFVVLELEKQIRLRLSADSAVRVTT